MQIFEHNDFMVNSNNYCRGALIKANYNSVCCDCDYFNKLPCMYED